MQGHVWAYSWPQKRASTSTDMATKCKRVSIVGVMRCEHSNWYFCSINVDYMEYTTINIMWVPIISIRVHYRFSILPIYTDYHIHLLLIYNIDKLSIKDTNLLHCFRFISTQYRQIICHFVTTIYWKVGIYLKVNTYITYHARAIQCLGHEHELHQTNKENRIKMSS